MTATRPEDAWLDEILQKYRDFWIDPHQKVLNTDQAKAAINARLAEVEERGAIKLRDMLSTGGRPLSAPPEIKKQPVPCPRCGAGEYADWTLYPHQLYNSYMPGGIGHYCFDCFCAIVSEVDKAERTWRTDEVQNAYNVLQSLLEDEDDSDEVTGMMLINLRQRKVELQRQQGGDK